MYARAQTDSSLSLSPPQRALIHISLVDGPRAPRWCVSAVLYFILSGGLPSPRTKFPAGFSLRLLSLALTCSVFYASVYIYSLAARCSREIHDIKFSL